ncbi:MAG: alpha-ketoglutarate-dependent dioxygenase AlkB family protein [Wenzhouxiangella sp.]
MSPSPEQVSLLAPAGRICFWPQWLAATEAELLLQTLMDELDWRQLPVRMFGRWIPQPRLVDFHADPGVSYTYAGLRLGGSGWPKRLDDLRRALTQIAGVEFNSVLCNLYRDGRDYMGWHADDEVELGRDPCIASISLGASRRFMLRPKRQRADAALRHEYRLDSGSLMLMKGDLQHHWQHQLPKALRVKEARVNLTFRRILCNKSAP